MNKKLGIKKYRGGQELFLRSVTTLALGLISTFSQAEIYTVSKLTDEIGSCDNVTKVCTSLRAAITAANNSTESEHTINLLADTYVLSIPGTDEDNNEMGDLDVNASITIKGVGSTPSSIDANHIDRVLSVESSNVVTLDNITVKNGNAVLGGGIYVHGAVGVYLFNSTVSNNNATHSGGGIYAALNGDVYISDSTLSDNSATEGGGIFVAGEGSWTSSLYLKNSTVSRNSATEGGGIYVTAFIKANLTNSTVAENIADRGGGLYVYDAGVYFGNSTVSQNVATVGGGVYIEGGDDPWLHYNNSVFAKNRADADGYSDCFRHAEPSATSSSGYNWFGTSVNCDTDPTDIIGQDPLLGVLSDNGGSVQTMFPQRGSGLIDAIKDAASCTITIDARGVKRPQDGDGDDSQYCDIGALEVETPVLIPAVAGGYQHSCAVKKSGMVYCWGVNEYGQLGNGSIATSTLPITVALPKQELATKAVAAGNNHSCVLTTTQHVYCWGQNRYGQLGNGTGVDSITPVLVSNLNNATSLTAGLYHTCASTTDGKAYCWGHNTKGQLGNETTESALAPVAVSNLNDVIHVGAGFYHSCAVAASGTAWCWGSNNHGQLGNDTTTGSNKPVAVNDMTKATSIAGGYGHTCAVTTDGKGYCWGYNLYGQLGDGTTKQRLTPVAVKNISNLSTITGGTKHSCALTTSDSDYCWGYNTSGQLGAGSSVVQSSIPLAISGLTEAVAIAAGGRHTLTMVEDNAGYAWGANDSGQVGDGTTINRKTPTSILFPGE